MSKSVKLFHEATCVGDIVSMFNERTSDESIRCAARESFSAKPSKEGLVELVSLANVREGTVVRQTISAVLGAMSNAAVLDIGHVYLRALVDVMIAASQGSDVLQKDQCIEAVHTMIIRLQHAQRLFASSQHGTKQAKQQAEELLVMMRVVSSVLCAMGNADMRDVPRDVMDPLEDVLKAVASGGSIIVESHALYALHALGLVKERPSTWSKIGAGVLHALEFVSLIGQAYQSFDLSAAVDAVLLVKDTVIASKELLNSYRSTVGSDPSKVSWFDLVRFGRAIIHNKQETDIKSFFAGKPFGKLSKKDAECASVLLLLEIKSLDIELQAKVAACIQLLESNILEKNRSILEEVDMSIKMPRSMNQLFAKARLTTGFMLQAARSKGLVVLEEHSLYVPGMCSVTPDSRNTRPLTETVDEFMRHADHKVLLLMGDSGMGKSMFLREVARTQWASFNNNDRGCFIPLVICLSTVSVENVASMVETAAKLSFGFNESQTNELKQRPLLLLLDAYDEIPGGALINLFVSASLSSCSQVKVIITSRPSVAAEADRPRLFAPKSGDAVLSNQLVTRFFVPFDQRQCEQYLDQYVKMVDPASQREGFRSGAEYMAQITSLQLTTLASVPFTLSLIAKVLPEVAKSSGKSAVLSKHIYDAFVRGVASRQFEKKDFKLPVIKGKPKWTADSYTQECIVFSQKLALAMSMFHLSEVPYDEDAEDNGNWEAFFGADNEVNQSLLAGCAIVRSATGYSFVHKSVLEHFVASIALNINIDEFKLSAPSRYAGAKREALKSLIGVVVNPMDVHSTAELAQSFVTYQRVSVMDAVTMQLLTQFSLDIIKTFESSIATATMEDVHEVLQLAVIPSKVIFESLFETLVNNTVKTNTPQALLLDGIALLLCVADDSLISSLPVYLLRTLDMILSLLKQSYRDDAQLFSIMNGLNGVLKCMLDMDVVIEQKKSESLTAAIAVLNGVSSDHQEVIAVVELAKQYLLHLRTDQSTTTGLFKRGKILFSGITSVIAGAKSYSPKQVWEGLQTTIQAFATNGKAKAWFDRHQQLEVLCEALLVAPTSVARDEISQNLRLAIDDLQKMKDYTESIEWLMVHQIVPKIHRARDNSEVRCHLYQCLARLPKGIGRLALPTLLEVEDSSIKSSLPAEVQLKLEQQVSTLSRLAPCFVDQSARLFRVAASESVLFKLALMYSSIIYDPLLSGEGSRYVALDGALDESPQSKRYPLQEKLEEFIGDEGKSVFLLIGASGSGKSLFVKQLCAMIWKQSVQLLIATTDESHRPLMPVFISLTGVSRCSTSVIEDALSSQYGFSVAQVQALRESQQYRFLFVLDGYDEMWTGDSGEMINVYQNNHLEKWVGSKVIITCRTQYLTSKDDLQSIFGPEDPRAFDTLTTVSFARSQIETYLKKSLSASQQSEHSAEWYLKQIEQIQGLSAMISNPFVLRIVVDVLPAIVTKREPKETVKLSFSEVYEAFAFHWFDRQLEKQVKAKQIRRGRNNTKAFFRYAMRFAQQMQADNVSRVSLALRELSESVEWQELLGDENRDAALCRQACPLFVDLSDASGYPFYQFMHDSLRAFFATRGRAPELEEATSSNVQTVASSGTLASTHDTSDAIRGKVVINNETKRSDASDGSEVIVADVEAIAKSVLNMRLFTRDINMLRFWADSVKESAETKAEFRKAIELSKWYPQVQVAAANAMTVLCMVHESFYSQDLRGIRVAGALMDYAFFGSADLSGADLTGCSMRGVFLENANLTRIKLTGADFGEVAPFKGHTGGVTCIDVSPCGRFLASGSWDHTVRIWDVSTGQLHGKPITPYHTGVLSVAFSGTGELLAFVAGTRIVLWDMNSMAQAGGPLLNDDRTINGLAFSPNGQFLASCGEWRAVRLWNVRAPKITSEFLRGHNEDVFAVAFSPDGKLLASGGLDEQFIFWDTSTRLIHKVLPTGRIFSISFHPSGSLVASASSDRKIKLWDVISGQLVGNPMEGHSGAIRSISFSPDGKILASGGKEGQTRLWDVSTGLAIGESLHGHFESVESVRFSSDGLYVLSASLDRTISKKIVRRVSTGIESQTGHSLRVNAVCFSLDDRILASCSSDQSISLMDVEKGLYIGRLFHHTKAVYALVFSPDGAYLASGGSDNIIKVWDIRKHTMTCVLADANVRLDDVRALCYHPDGDILASGSLDGRVCLWKLSSPSSIHGTIMEHRGGVYSLAFSPNGKVLASGSSDESVRLWDAETGRNIKSIRHSHEVRLIAFNHDGDWMVSGGYDTSLRFWHRATGDAIGSPMQVHSHYVYALALRHDDAMLATGCKDSTIRLWDTKSRLPIGEPLKGHTQSVYSLAFSHSGKLLASGSGDGVMRMWRVESRACCFRSGADLRLEATTIEGAELDEGAKALFSAAGVNWNPLSQTSLEVVAGSQASKAEYPREEEATKEASSVPSISKQQPSCSHVDNQESNSSKSSSSVVDTTQETKGVEPKATVNAATMPSAFEKHSICSSDGTVVAEWGGDLSFTVSDAKSGSEIIDILHQLPKHARVTDAAFSSSGRFLYATLEDFSVLAWDLSTKSLIVRKQASEAHSSIQYSATGVTQTAAVNPISSSEASEAGFHACSSVHSSDGKYIVTWGPHVPFTLTSKGMGAESINLSKQLPAADKIISAGFTENNQLIALVSDDLTVLLWSIQERRLVPSHSVSEADHPTQSRACQIM